MSLESLQLPAVILIYLAGLITIAGIGWRINLIAFGCQYIGVFFLLAKIWPLPMAFAMFVSGMIAVGVLFTVQYEVSTDSVGEFAQSGLFVSGGEGRWEKLAGFLFQIFVSSLVILVVLSIIPLVTEWIPTIETQPALGAMMLIGFGLLHLGLTSRPLRIIVGLLTLLAGFEVIYAAVEFSTLVAGLLAGVQMGLALVGAYLMLTPSLEMAE